MHCAKTGRTGETGWLESLHMRTTKPVTTHTHTCVRTCTLWNPHTCRHTRQRHTHKKHFMLSIYCSYRFTILASFVRRFEDWIVDIVVPKKHTHTTCSILSNPLFQLVGISMTMMTTSACVLDIGFECVCVCVFVGGRYSAVLGWRFHCVLYM